MAFVTKKETGPKTIVKGFLTGAVETIVGYPTEYVKTQLQLQSRTHPEYDGMVDCARKTVRQNGFKGLYRGAMPLVFGAGAKQMLRWGIYNNVSAMFRDENNNLSVFATGACGTVAGIGEAALAVTPIETIKTRVTDDYRKGTGRYKGSVDGTIKIFKEEGLLGLYRGAGPTIVRQGMNQTLRFPIQVQACKMITMGDESLKSSPFWNGLAGVVAGCGSVVITQPVDVVKTRMQGESAKELYKNMFDCAMKTYSKEGVTAFYFGIVPRLVRVGLSTGVSFTCYPLITTLLNSSGLF